VAFGSAGDTDIPFDYPKWTLKYDSVFLKRSEHYRIKNKLQKILYSHYLIGNRVSLRKKMELLLEALSK
jgi:hypothetical protein